MPWAGYWYPYSKDGIRDAARKYDRAVGGAGAETWELSNHGTSLPGIQDWWGHCNGWSAAALLVREPRSPRTVNGVEFTISDQKALFTEAGMEVTADFFGTRVDDPSDTRSEAFQDVYPNQFFLVLTQFLGQGFPLVMDRYTGAQVWNQPLAGYQIGMPSPSDYLGADPSAPQVYRILLATTVWWARDDVAPDHLSEPFQFRDSPSFQSRVLKYELWLDGPVRFDEQGRVASSGDVILTRSGTSVLGGAWRNGSLPAANSHPDYLWIPKAFARPSGYANPRVDLSWLRSRFQ